MHRMLTKNPKLALMHKLKKIVLNVGRREMIMVCGHLAESNIRGWIQSAGAVEYTDCISAEG